MRGLEKVDMKRGQTDRQTDIATTRKNRPKTKGQLFENQFSSKIESGQCSYHASSTTVLKRHITTNHNSIHKPEVLRELDSNQPLHLKHPTGERGVNSDTSQEVKEVEIKCEYKRCDFIRNTSSDLEINIKKKHTINESYKSPMSTIEV